MAKTEKIAYILEQVGTVWQQLLSLSGLFLLPRVVHPADVFDLGRSASQVVRALSAVSNLLPDLALIWCSAVHVLLV